MVNGHRTMVLSAPRSCRPLAILLASRFDASALGLPHVHTKCTRRKRRKPPHDAVLRWRRQVQPSLLWPDIIAIEGCHGGLFRPHCVHVSSCSGFMLWPFDASWSPLSMPVGRSTALTVRPVLSYGLIKNRHRTSTPGRANWRAA